MSEPRTCYIRFDASPQEYAYDCGALNPKAGDLVIVLVREDKPKIVTCVDVRPGIDPIVSKKIYGVVTRQPEIETALAAARTKAL